MADFQSGGKRLGRAANILARRRGKLIISAIMNSRLGKAYQATRTKVSGGVDSPAEKIKSSPRTAVPAVILGMAAVIVLMTLAYGYKITELQHIVDESRSQIRRQDEQLRSKDRQIAESAQQLDVLRLQLANQQQQLDASQQRIAALSNPHSMDDIPWYNGVADWVKDTVGVAMAGLLKDWIESWIRSAASH